MREGIKTRLRDMEWAELEQLVASLWERRGYETKRTQGRKDGGYDVIARRDHPYRRTVLIQVKSGTTTLSSPKVREYAALRQQPDVDEVIIITTTDISAPALDEAHTYNVKLIGCDQFARLIEENNAFDLIGLSLIDDTSLTTDATQLKNARPETHQTHLPANHSDDSPDPTPKPNPDAVHDAVREKLDGFTDLKTALQSTYDQLHSALTQDTADSDAYQSWVGLRDTTNNDIIQQFCTGAHVLRDITDAQRTCLTELTDKSALTVIDDSDEYCTVSLTGNRGMTGWDPSREAAAAMALLVVVGDRTPSEVDLLHTGSPVWS